MRQNLLTWLAGIMIVTLLAGYVDMSNTIGFGDPKNGGFARDVHTRLGLDLQGGLQLVLQAEPRNPENPVTPEQLNAARNILEERAAGTGASEPVVQTAEGNRILVELPGIQNLEDATSVIQQTAFLEIVSSGDVPLTEGTFVCSTEGCPRPEQLRVQSTPTTTSSEPTATSAVTSTGTITATQTVTGTSTSAGTSTTATPEPAPTPPTETYKTIVTGDQIDGSKVLVQFNPTTGQPEVSFTLKGDGPKVFGDFTQANIGKYMPILLDKKVISSPRIIGAIIGGQGQITGLSADEARRLALQLKYGALPVSLRPIESRKISATLGQEAIDKSITAGIIGLGLVVLFMIAYYRLPGVLASVALIIYAVITYAIFKLVPVTLTLAGIAGFILSIGMAVDANVLIFARLKEELRSGKTLGAAVEAGFDHAWPSIRDSNVSTLITCAILYWFGSTFGGASIIKGFALTLAIGVIVSLFTAITVTRTFLRAIVGTRFSKSRWAFFLDQTRSPSATTTEA
ncbi:MAG TPA: protein translocase subunit SecD [Chloroflexia bacterium]